VGVHDEHADQAVAYALGALEPEERASFEAHLANCLRCAAEVRALSPVAAALATTSPAVAPSPGVRQRLLEAIGGPTHGAARVGPSSPRRSHLSYYALAASVALAAFAGGYAMQLRGRVTTLEARLRDATLRADTNERLVADARHSGVETQRTVLVLAAPDLARIDLTGQPAAPQASARAFWSRSRGLVFTASNLPAPPPGRAYQLWVLTAQPAPISAGMLKLDANGRTTAMIDTPQDIPKPVAMAVTLEPEAGVPSPTGDKYLVGLAN
jgi:anti-sigma-K factor RskA